MATLSVAFRLDRSNRRFRTGEDVAGDVVVHADEAVELDGVALVLGWRVEGKGRPHEEVCEEIELVPGPRSVRPGRSAEFPFRTTLPYGPVSYAGKYLRVVWFLSAEADVPWGRDPGAELELTVEPGPGVTAVVREPYLNPTRDHVYEDDAARSLANVGTLALFVLGFACVGALAVLQIGPGNLGPFHYAFGGVVALPLVVLVYRRIRSGLAETRLGPVEVDVPPVVRAGEPVEISVEMRPESDVELRKGTAAMVGREKVVSRRGQKQDASFVHELYRARITLARNERLRVHGGARAFQGTLEVPADAPPPFVLPRQRLEWLFEVRLEIPSWPDWVREIPVRVEPVVKEHGR